MRKGIGGIAAILMVVFSIFLSLDLFLSGFPLYINYLGGQEYLIGIFAGVFALSGIAFRPFFAQIGRKYGQKWVLLVSACVATTVPWLYFGTTAIWALLLVRIYHGILLASFISASQVLLMNQCGEEHKGLGIGLFGVVGGLSMMFGPYLGAFLFLERGLFPWILVSSLSGVLALVCWLHVYRHVDEVLYGQEVGAKPNVRTVWVPLVANLSYAVGLGAVITFVPTYALQLGYANPGQFFSVLAFVIVGTRLSSGLLADRLPSRHILIPAGCCLLMGLVLMAFPPTPWWVIASAVPIGIGFFASASVLMLYVTEQVSPEHRSVVNAYMVNAFDLGFMCGSIGLGFVATYWSYSHLYLLAATSALMGVCLITTKLKEQKPGSTRHKPGLGREA